MFLELPSIQFFSKILNNKYLCSQEYEGYFLGKETHFFITNNITDLGLREDKNSHFFVKNILDKMEKHKLLEFFGDSIDYFLANYFETDFSKTSYNYILNDEKMIIDSLEYYIVRLGSWDDAYAISKSFIESEYFSNCKNTHLLFYIACILAVKKDEKCFEIFDDIQDKSLYSYENFSFRFRKLVASIKHIRNSKTHSIDENLRECTAFLSCLNAKEGLFSFCNSMISNLMALYYLQEGKPVEAESSIQKAISFIEEAISLGVPELEYDLGIIHRYKIQIYENYAMLFHMNGNIQAAVDCMRSLIIYCRQYSPDFLIESLSIYAYSLILNEEKQEAVTVLNEVLVLTSGVMSAFPLIRQKAHEMLLVACD